MAEYYICRNCGNEEPGTNLYSCSNRHQYCHICAEIIIYDMLRIICPVCRQNHKEIYGTIRKQKYNDDFDDNNIDDFIDDDIHDYADDI